MATPKEAIDGLGRTEAAVGDIGNGSTVSDREVSGEGSPEPIPVAVSKAPKDTAEVSAVKAAMDRDVRPWIDLIDKLRAFGIEQDLPIPQLSVMGDQSSGKSSVLEFISGIPFPRGTGLVTRCATQLTMKRVPGVSFRGKAELRWNQAQPEAAGPITCKEEVSEKIERLTEAAVGESTFSDHTVVVEIEAPDVPDLTIIDLPGLVRTTTAGQSKSVIKQVDALVQRYLESERTIILAVVPATVDIATSDILERAHQVDPDGVRTVGVLTKLDLVGAGAEEEVVDILDNVRKPLNLGYVGVRCRSAADLRANMSLATAVKEERIFFETHPVFSRLRKDVYGVETLTAKLTRVLVSRIRAAVPTMAAEVAEQLKATEGAIAEVGSPPPTTPEAQREYFVSRVGIFSDLLQGAVSARYDDQMFDNLAMRVCTTASHEFGKFALRLLKQLRPPFEEPPYLEKIAEIVRRCRGLELRCFPTVGVLDTLVRQAVAQWKEPTTDCLEATVAALREAVRTLVDHVFGKYPPLSMRLEGVAEELIDTVSVHCGGMLERLMTYESLHPQTLNEAFMSSVHDQRKELLSSQSSSTDESTRVPDRRDICTKNLVNELEDLQSPQEILTAFRAFWSVSSVRYIDYVALVISHEVLNEGYKRLKDAFYVALAFPDLPSLFVEDGGLFVRREALEAKRTRLRSAQAAMRSLCTT